MMMKVSSGGKPLHHWCQVSACSGGENKYPILFADWFIVPLTTAHNALQLMLITSHPTTNFNDEDEETAVDEDKAVLPTTARDSRDTLLSKDKSI